MPSRDPVEIELRPIDEVAGKAKYPSISPITSVEASALKKKNQITISSAAPISTVVNNPTVHVHSPSTPRVVAVVSFYIVSSISMIMINKMVLKQVGLPIAFLWGQLVVAAAVLRLGSSLHLITLPTISWSLLQSIAPLIAINVVGLVLNTLCLHHIDAVLYQVARSLILPITVSLSPILGQRISGSTVVCCAIISIGFVIGVFGERVGAAQISVHGVVFGVLSSLSTAIHSFVIKSSFTTVKHSGAFDLVYLNNLFSALFLAPLLLIEFGPIQNFAGQGGWPAIHTFLMGTVLAGVAGLLINFAGFLQIKVTSPVTHTVSSAARGVLQTIAANLFLGEAITLARCIGIAVTLLGSCAYSLVKAREGKTAIEYSKVQDSSSASAR